MSAFPNSPRLVKGGIVLVDPDSGELQRITLLQYNPDTLTGALQPQANKEGWATTRDPWRKPGVRR